MRLLKSPAWPALILILCLALAACTAGGGQTTEQPSATEEPAVEEPVTEEEAPAEEPAAEEEAATEEPAAEEPAAEGDRKIATFIWTQEFDTLSPLYTGMWFTTTTYGLWNVWAWHFDEESNPIPVLVTEMPSAENGGISEDGRTITMTLRDDIVWSDGTPVTSEDFVFTYEMSIDPANTVGSTYPYDSVASMEAPDPQTVVINFAEPFAPWLATLWHYVLPAHVLRPVFEADGTLDEAEWNLAPTVGVGPYRFEEWESGSFARFVRNENWHGEPAIIDEIFFRFVPDDASQVAALQNGEGDLGTFIAYSDVPTLTDAGIGIVTQPSGYNEGWFLILGDEDVPGHPAMQDVRVRQAIAMALDRETLNQDLLLGLTNVPDTVWASLPAYVSPDIEPWPYDPAAANALLDEAGWVDSNGDGTRDKDGEELVLVHGTTTREIRQDAQAVAQQQLAEVGITLELASFDSNVFFASFAEGGPPYTGELDIAEWSDAPSFPDPDHYYWDCAQIPTDEAPDGGNFQRICDEELDALFTLQRTQTNVEERQATFHQISKLMHDQVYWLGMWEDPDVWAVSPRLTNVRFSGATPLFSVAEWDIVE
ncbi:putative Extracellular solute-binding protein family 5 [Candidatus Promineifilum breve]|uniref:Extracellular solute-binding protein family 5 n=1 Tax=Candidatus Promineifilum breve TaxID=1806508 RepID=A0A161K5P7_9CHLR|nr:peptide ABC transporter substrate-binding protein [Candidatus Promineifilum breve]CUS05207.2 putative Extracellular solute-binding protein family 5 [Candidatus Promineifilum breve]